MTTWKGIPQEVIDAFVGAAHGDFETVKNLLEEYPLLVQARARWNESAIESAAQTGRVDIVELLLASGAALDICSAAMLGRKDVVTAMLEKEPALIHAQGAHGIPLLYFPVIVGNREIAELVLAHGANINAGEGINTPLHGAVLFGQEEMATWLLERGARLDVRDYNDKTPRDVAQANGSKAILALFDAL